MRPSNCFKTTRMRMVNLRMSISDVECGETKERTRACVNLLQGFVGSYLGVPRSTLQPSTKLPKDNHPHNCIPVSNPLQEGQNQSWLNSPAVFEYCSQHVTMVRCETSYLKTFPCMFKSHFSDPKDPGGFRIPRPTSSGAFHLRSLIFPSRTRADQGFSSSRAAAFGQQSLACYDRLHATILDDHPE